MGADGEQEMSTNGTDEPGRGGGAFALGAMIGAALGAVVGLLWAPRSGTETRAMIKEKGEDTAETLKTRGEEMAATAREKGEAAKGQLESTLSRGSDDGDIADDDYLNTATDWGSGP
jgi:gas vesicle protein